MTSISLRLPDIDAQLIKAYARSRGETTTDFLKRAALEEIKREYEKLLGEQEGE